MMLKLLFLILVVCVITTLCKSSSITTKSTKSIFSNNGKNDVGALKYQILQLGASLDRGQSLSLSSLSSLLTLLSNLSSLSSL